MTEEMIDRESVRISTEKFLKEGNKIEKFPYTRDSGTYGVFKSWYRPNTNHEPEKPWTEDVRYWDGHRKHPFQILSEKEWRKDRKFMREMWEKMNKVLLLFKHENRDWKENHLEEVWEMEWDRDNYLI